MVRAKVANASHSKRSAARYSGSLELSFGYVMGPSLVRTISKGELLTRKTRRPQLTLIGVFCCADQVQAVSKAVVSAVGHLPPDDAAAAAAAAIRAALRANVTEGESDGHGDGGAGGGGGPGGAPRAVDGAMCATSVVATAAADADVEGQVETAAGGANEAAAGGRRTRLIRVRVCVGAVLDRGIATLHACFLCPTPLGESSMDDTIDDTMDDTARAYV